MIRKFTNIFHHRSQTISSAAFVVAGFTALGALLSIFRNSLLAAKFGAGSELDIYYASFRIPDFVYGIFYLGVVSVLFLPIFNDFYERDKHKAWRFFGAMVSWITIVLGLGAVVLAFAAPWVAKLIVPGFSEEQLALVVKMTRFMLLQPILLGVSNIISGTLQSFQRFAAAALGHVFYNLGIIIGIVFFVPGMGVVGLAWGVVLGALLHLLIQLPSFMKVREGFPLRIVPDFEIIRPHLALIPPRFFNVISNQINLFAITILASTAAAGSLAVFNLAKDIQTLPQTAIAVSFAVAAFPTMSKLAFHDKKKLERIFNTVMRRIIFFLVPISLLVLVFRAQIVRLILGYGQFGWEDTRLTLDTLMVFAFGMVFQGLIPFFVRAYFSMQNTVVPFVSALIGNIITIGGGILLLSEYGVVGLAGALVAANIVQAFVLGFVLQKYIRINVEWLMTQGAQIFIASVIAALSGRLWLEIFDLFFNNETVAGLALQTLFSGTLALGTLSLLFYVFRIEEFFAFIGAIKRRLKL